MIDDETQRLSEVVLKTEEGYSRFPYLDTKKILTIGYGRNLVATGLSESESYYLLKNDIEEARAKLTAAMPRFRVLNPVRQTVLISMTVQMGIRGVLNFVRMVTAIEVGNYMLAGKEIMDSKFAKKDTPERAVRMARMMESGELLEYY